MRLLDSFDGENPKIGIQADTPLGRVGLLSAKVDFAKLSAFGEDAHPNTNTIRNKRLNLVITNGMSFILLLFNLIFFANDCEANVPEEPTHGVAVFAGPGSMTPLVELGRFRQFSIENNYIIGLAYDRTLLKPSEAIAFEVEGSLTKYLETFDAFSLSGAFVIRWLKTPWSSEASGFRSTFAFGNGLSFASTVPELESRLERTSNLLYHLFLEVTLSLDRQSPWEFLFRIQHRSGAFGLFNGVVGGSDFLCLGLRYRF